MLQRCGARFTLPFGLQDLVCAMRQQFDADDPPVDATCGGHGPHALIGESAALHAVRTVLHKFAPVELPGRGSRLGEPAVEDFGQLVSLLCAEQRQAMRRRSPNWPETKFALKSDAKWRSSVCESGQ